MIWKADLTGVGKLKQESKKSRHTVKEQMVED